MTDSQTSPDFRFFNVANKNARWRFFVGTLDDLVGWFYQAKSSRTAHTVAVCNVHMFIEAERDVALERAIASTSFAICDGQPIAWLVSLLSRWSVARVTGPDLFVEILQNHLDHFRVALVGGDAENLSEILLKLKGKRTENILTLDPGRVPADGTVSDEIAQALEAFLPDIIFVGLGCPKQEKWMHNASQRIPGAYVGVGAAFRYFTGEIHRVPTWVGRLGLEWLFRLFQQPRLLRRYASTNFSFLAVLALAALNPSKLAR